MKTIALLIPSLSSAGGAEKLIESLSALLGQSYRIVQISFDATDTPRFFDSNVEHVALGPVHRLPIVLRLITYITLAFRLRRAKRKFNVDITISTLWGADLISAISGGRDKKISLVLIDLQSNSSNRLLVQLRYFVTYIYRRFDLILCIGKSLSHEITRLFRLPATKVGVFRNFLDYITPEAVFQDDGITRYVFCGRLVHEKNIDGLLIVWSEFMKFRTDFQLVIIGDGPLKSEMMALATALDLRVGTHSEDTKASVLFVGTVTQPQNYMVNAHALMLTSRHEGTPTVILLALSLGLPVLASDCPSGGVRELMLDNRNYSIGRLLPVPDIDVPGTIEAWVQSLDYMEESTEERASWRQAALELSRSYQPEAVKSFWQSTIRDLLG